MVRLTNLKDTLVRHLKFEKAMRFRPTHLHRRAVRELERDIRIVDNWILLHPDNRGNKPIRHLTLLDDLATAGWYRFPEEDSEPDVKAFLFHSANDTYMLTASSSYCKIIAKGSSKERNVEIWRGGWNEVLTEAISIATNNYP